MRTPYRKNYPGIRGMALLAVILVISLLTVIVLEFNKAMRHEMTWNRNYEAREQLSVVLESGLNLAVASLHLDSHNNDYDSHHDDWAKLIEIPKESLNFKGRTKMNITDLSSRFQVNSLVKRSGNDTENSGKDSISPKDARRILFRLLVSDEIATEDEFQAEEIIDSIIDWLDRDDIITGYGAENAYYQSLKTPYQIRNGLMMWSNEILAVKGCTPLLLFGDDEKKGLADYITVYGDHGKININTADIEVISALGDKVGREDAELIVEFRSDENNHELLKNRSWYKNVPGLTDSVEIKNDLITTSSTFFNIKLEAELDGVLMKMTAIVKRYGREKVEILYRKVD